MVWAFCMSCKIVSDELQVTPCDLANLTRGLLASPILWMPCS